MFKLMCCRKEQGAACYLMESDKSQFDNTPVGYMVGLHLPQCCVCDSPKLILYYYDKNKQLLGNLKINPSKVDKVLKKSKVHLLKPKLNKFPSFKSSWYLNYNCWGAIKPCYSNFHNIKLGQIASWYEDLR
jgi:hypothetical protein